MNATTYTYATLNRPAMYGTVPEGFSLLSSPKNETGLDIISYDQPLSAEQMKRYELIPVSENAYEFALNQMVLVNECDEAVITGFATRGRYNVIYSFDGKTTDCVKSSEISALEGN